MNKLLIKLDHFLYMNSYRLPYKYMVKFEVPSKRLVRYCWKNHEGDKVRDWEEVAHGWAFDNTLTDLEQVAKLYERPTIERVRQLLAKFVRKYYRRKNE